jgi:hypothetical protein
VKKVKSDLSTIGGPMTAVQGRCSWCQAASNGMTMVTHDFKESTWSGKQVYACSTCKKRTVQCQNFDQGEECRGMACGGEGLLTYVARLAEAFDLFFAMIRFALQP